MKNFLSNLIKLVLSILILIFAEEYFFKLMNFLGMNLTNVSSNIVSLIVYTIITSCIYIVYKPELKSAFNKYQHKLGSNLLYSVIAFVITFVSIMLTNYIVKAVANSFSITYNGLSFISIFNQTFDLNLIITFIKFIIIIPFIRVVIFVLGTNNLFNSKNAYLLSGLLYASYSAYLLKGSFSYILINVIPDFVLFAILSYIYKKNNNIAFSIIAYMLYMLFAGLLSAKII